MKSLTCLLVSIPVFGTPIQASLRPAQAAAGEAASDLSPQEMLVLELEEHAQWCRKNRALLALTEIYRLMLDADPDHKRARGYLGYKYKKGVWLSPEEPRERRDASLEVAEEGMRRFAGAKASYCASLQQELWSEYLSAEEILAVEEHLLRLNPDDPVVHKKRGEVPFEGTWVMRETMLARTRRALFHTFIKGELIKAEPGIESKPEGLEQKLKLKFNVVKTSRIRALSTTSMEESLELTRILPVAQALFNEVMQGDAILPYGLRLFVLNEKEERDVFLNSYPGLDDKYIEELRLVSGTGLRGTQDWTFWRGDRAKRKDGLVRMAIAFFLNDKFKISFEHGWFFEGLGIYLTHAVVGTRLTTFQQMGRGQLSKDAMKERGALTSPETNWMREALRLLHTWNESEYEDIFAKPVHDMQRGDLLASYATLAYLIEAHPDKLARIARAVPRATEPSKLISSELDMSLGELIDRLTHWIEESHGEEFVPPIAAAQLTNDWDRLEPAKRAQAISLFRTKVERLETPQMEVIRSLLATGEEEFADRTPAAFYSPEVHAPAMPIRRKLLLEKSSLVIGANNAFFREPLPQAQIRAYEYEWGTGNVVKVRAALSDEEVFENASNGYAPGLDLAHCIALRELDAGQQRTLQAAFEHAYTDREGGVYPGISLYEAWSSRDLMEMPDVDTLGLYHEITEDWDSYVAPIDGSLHNEFYGILEAYFARARKYRDLRIALADCLLEGEPLNGQFSGTRTNMHAMWAEYGSDPTQVRDLLPPDFGQAQWVQQRIAIDAGDPLLWDAGEIRRKNLAEDANRIRHAMSKAIAEVQ